MISHISKVTKYKQSDEASSTLCREGMSIQILTEKTEAAKQSDRAESVVAENLSFLLTATPLHIT